MQALPPGALQPLPKRPALEKNNGATTVFNPSVFHYQQALANMQLQQPTFIPTGMLSLILAEPRRMLCEEALADAKPFALHPCLGLYNRVVWLPLVCQAGCFSDDSVWAQLPPFPCCFSVTFDGHILTSLAG